MGAISKIQAVEIAVRHAKDLKLDEFVVLGVFHSKNDGIGFTDSERALLGEDERAFLEEDEREPRWNVILGFVDNPDDQLGFPSSVMVYVDESTGRPWTIKTL